LGNCKKFILGIFIFLILSFSISPLRGQDQVNIKKLEKEAYNHAKAGEWYFALPLFIKLSELEPNNAEYAFTMGECYFNTIDKAKGLNYFKQASQEGHKSDLINFYLGRAFHFNLLFDSAIIYYNKF
jgi:tetratricopeptide (TPR) repeat protein